MSVTCWTPYPDCDDFYCNIHKEHAADCAYPSVDVWVESGLWPYENEVNEDVLTFVTDNPLVDE